jgi:5,10-methylenetetrahydromethanopterin reductase
VRIDIRIPVGRPLPELAEIARRCEDAGFHGIGVHDHHHTGRDAYLGLAVAAERTTRLALYPATTNTVTRHPLVLAALAHSLWEIAPGRVMLTLAPGFLSVEKAGSQQARREELRTIVTAIRTLLAGEEAQLNGTPARLSNAPDRPPDVLLLASGPRLIELAGEVADGAIMLVGLHPDSVAAAREHLRIGARRAGRDPAGLHEVLIVPAAIGATEEARTWPRRDFRPGLPWLRYPSRSNLTWLRAAGIDLPNELHPEDISPADAERICDALGIFGPPEFCAERLLRAQEEVGLEHAFLFPVHTIDTTYDIPVAEIDAFARIIGPRLGGAR